MIFNSLSFLIFFPLVLISYYAVPVRLKNIILLIASLVFYGWWDTRFLFLVVASSAIGFLSSNAKAHDKFTLRQITVTNLFLVGAGLLACMPNLKAYIVSDWVMLSAISKQSGFINGDLFTGVFSFIIILNLFYVTVLKINPKNKSKIIFVSNIALNLLILCFFKYFNFFLDSFSDLLSSFNISLSTITLHIILPMGISFFTFQAMSYSIDTQLKKISPEKHFTDLLLYISFFPQLVAGPIERAERLLPQIHAKHRKITSDDVKESVYRIAYGLFKKVVIADGIAKTVDQIYSSTGTVTGFDVALATVLFAVQIFCDFSGYSDIAIGTARLLGFRLMENFKYPYFSVNPKEFWENWHISLSSWLRDYLYISLGGNRKGKIRTYVNLFITMLLGGLWHGASWNFVLWGAYQGGILIMHRIFYRKVTMPSNWAALWIRRMLFFIIVCYGWLLFRAHSFDTIALFTKTLFTVWPNFTFHADLPTTASLFGIPIFLLIEYLSFKVKSPYFYLYIPSPVSAAINAALILGLILGLTNSTGAFIYFAF